jgi:hypothetical protein
MGLNDCVCAAVLGLVVPHVATIASCFTSVFEGLACSWNTMHVCTTQLSCCCLYVDLACSSGTAHTLQHDAADTVL